MLALWRTEHPRFAASHAQPLKGILTTLVAMVGGAAVCLLYFVTVGGGIRPPAPMLIEFAIAGVVITFLVCIVWGGWPANALVKGPVAAGVLQLVGGFLLNFLLFPGYFSSTARVVVECRLRHLRIEFIEATAKGGDVGKLIHTGKVSGKIVNCLSRTRRLYQRPS